MIGFSRLDKTRSGESLRPEYFRSGGKWGCVSGAGDAISGRFARSDRGVCVQFLRNALHIFVATTLTIRYI